MREKNGSWLIISMAWFYMLDNLGYEHFLNHTTDKELE